MNRETALTMMSLALAAWQGTVDIMSPTVRRELAIELEAIAERAAMLAEYLNERHGAGCGDQGHQQAMRKANKAGQAVHMKVFGYNAYHDLRV
jgi:hypothetical protein